jgi:hypothetical protein
MPYVSNLFEQELSLTQPFFVSAEKNFSNKEVVFQRIVVEKTRFSTQLYLFNISFKQVTFPTTK